MCSVIRRSGYKVSTNSPCPVSTVSTVSTMSTVSTVSTLWSEAREVGWSLWYWTHVDEEAIFRFLLDFLTKFVSREASSKRGEKSWAVRQVTTNSVSAASSYKTNKLLLLLQLPPYTISLLFPLLILLLLLHLLLLLPPYLIFSLRLLPPFLPLSPLPFMHTSHPSPCASTVDSILGKSNVFLLIHTFKLAFHSHQNFPHWLALHILHALIRSQPTLCIILN